LTNRHARKKNPVVDKPRKRRSALIAVLLLAPLALLLVSAIVDGPQASTWFALGAALVGVLAGASSVLVRAILVETVRRPTQRTLLKREGGGITVLDERSGKTLAHYG
jgi:MFS family permease